MGISGLLVGEGLPSKFDVGVTFFKFCFATSGFGVEELVRCDLLISEIFFQTVDKVIDTFKWAGHLRKHWEIIEEFIFVW